MVLPAGLWAKTCTSAGASHGLMSLRDVRGAHLQADAREELRPRVTSCGLSPRGQKASRAAMHAWTGEGRGLSQETCKPALQVRLGEPRCRPSRTAGECLPALRVHGHDGHALQSGAGRRIVRRMHRQVVRGDFAVVEGLPGEVERARRAAGLSWPELARGSGWSRQYLQRTVHGRDIPAAVLEYLAARLGLRLTITPTTPLLAGHVGAT